MAVIAGGIAGFVGWFLIRYLLTGFFTVDQNELAVLTSFGRAHRLEGRTTLQDPISQSLREEERERYAFPQVEIVRPGGPYFKWPWQEIHKVSISTQLANMAMDPEDPAANHGGTSLEAVTKDQLNISLKGQIRFRICEQNLYAYLFGVKNPIAHVMGYFVSVLRERIANFESPDAKTGQAPVPVEGDLSGTSGISINDLRKNLHAINEHMFTECRSSAPRYGISLEASLITAIDPPKEVEAALAAINIAHNEVSSDLSVAQAAADQKIVQSRKAVEIETLKAQAEVEPLVAQAAQLSALKAASPATIPLFLRSLRQTLVSRAARVIVEGKE